MAKKDYASYGLTGVLREAYTLPDRIQAALTKPNAAKPGAAKAAKASGGVAAHREIFRLLRRTRVRARRLLKAILKAMADEPNPMTIEQAIARAYARAAPAPEPVTTPRPIAPRPTPRPLADPPDRAAPAVP